MAELTKEQMAERIATLEAQVEQQQQALQKLSAKGEGWLITSPNPVFDGQVYGIQFVNGQAFIRKGQEVPTFEIEPMKDSKIAKYNIPPEEVKAIREREKTPTAVRAVEALVSDLGYKAEFFGADRLLDLQQQIDNRLSQRVQAESLLAQQIEAEKIMTPKFRGR